MKLICHKVRKLRKFFCQIRAVPQFRDIVKKDADHRSF